MYSYVWCNLLRPAFTYIKYVMPRVSRTARSISTTAPKRAELGRPAESRVENYQKPSVDRKW